MTQHNMGPWETTVFAGAEDDHVYVNGVDFGNTIVDLMENSTVSSGVLAACMPPAGSGAGTTA